MGYLVDQTNVVEKLLTSNKETWRGLQSQFKFGGDAAFQIQFK